MLINTEVCYFLVYLSLTHKFALKEQIVKRLCGLVVKINK